MSRMRLDHVMERIRTAGPRSPIALFRVAAEAESEAGSLDSVDAVFGATARSVALIEADEPSFLGSYHGEMDQWFVRSNIESQLRAGPELYTPPGRCKTHDRAACFYCLGKAVRVAAPA